MAKGGVLSRSSGFKALISFSIPNLIVLAAYVANIAPSLPKWVMGIAR